MMHTRKSMLFFQNELYTFSSSIGLKVFDCLFFVLTRITVNWTRILHKSICVRLKLDSRRIHDNSCFLKKHYCRFIVCCPRCVISPAKVRIFCDTLRAFDAKDWEMLQFSGIR